MFKPVKAALLAALDQVINQDQYADKVLQKAFKLNRKFGSRDRREFAESLYDIVRHYRLLAHLGGKSIEEMLEYYLGSREHILGDRTRYNVSFPVQESISDDFYELLVSELGEAAARREILAMNSQAPVCLRTNTLVVTREELQKKLLEEDIETEVAENDWGLFLKERKNVFTTQAFKRGEFEVQDLGSQKIAPMLELEPGQRVIDACAGAGGKTLHIAAMLKSKGRIISLDIHEWKLHELKLRARRAQVSNVETRVIDSQKVIKRLHDSADRLLLDVPCTGSGVLRRNPDSKMKWSREQYQNLLSTQSEILFGYEKMLKKGGKMIYATCSLLPSENQKQLQKFLSEKSNEWVLEEEMSLYPSQGAYDGFYAARLKKL